MPEYRTDDDQAYRRKGEVEGAFEEMTVHEKNLQLTIKKITIGLTCVCERIYLSKKTLFYILDIQTLVENF